MVKCSWCGELFNVKDTDYYTFTYAPEEIMDSVQIEDYFHVDCAMKAKEEGW